MKKITLILLVAFIMNISTNVCSAYDYSGQEYVGTLPWKDGAETFDDVSEYDGYDEFCIQYEKNKKAEDHLANLLLVEKYLPRFYGTDHEASLYDVKTEAVYLWRQKEKSPMAIAGFRFDIRDNTGYVIAGLTNLDYRNITAFRIRFAVLDKKGVPTGKLKDHYYAVGANIGPGETDAFIWQVDGMTEPQSLSDFHVIELVFNDRSKWYARMES